MMMFLLLASYLVGALIFGLLIFSAQLRHRVWDFVRNLVSTTPKKRTQFKQTHINTAQQNIFKRFFNSLNHILPFKKTSTQSSNPTLASKNTHRVQPSDSLHTNKLSDNDNVSNQSNQPHRHSINNHQEEEHYSAVLPFWHGDGRKYGMVILSIIVLTITPVIWVMSRNSHDSLEIDDLNNNYADVDNPQIHALLIGEQLKPPAPPPEELFDQLQQELTALGTQTPNPFGHMDDNTQQQNNPLGILKDPNLNTKDNTSIDAKIETLGAADIKSADRKWDRMNSQYVQRLLVVFKIMKEKHGYDMVLLEGYRSPLRQNRLAAMGSNVTKATGFRSYHQFGVAADCAFIRNGKIVISERDPWAMEGYRKYGEAAESVGLTWGGRWKMMDLGHTEMRIKGILGNPAIAEKMTNGTS